MNTAHLSGSSCTYTQAVTELAVTAGSGLDACTGIYTKIEAAKDDSPSHKCADLAGGSRDAVARGTDIGGEHLTRQEPCGGIGAKLACIM